ncbi:MULTISPECIES: hydroxypyruvate isomerase family protein [Kocuria]|uniref:hydroxypyruvate isomerase family protein n=1 Tax=Kocuria TaxID=57493 RepID=UPI000660474F|nr:MULTISPECIES: TIM barrel protein [Kocuria]MCT1367630.1 TIM barrel protein [Rothia sp. p3-SID1597]RUQ20853.1 hydroxypyruvate isomerase [Kocuria sp. HSID16901]
MSYTVNASILLTDLPINDRPQAVADAGFTRAEFWWPFPTPTPSQAEVDAFVTALRDAGIQLTGLNFYAGDMPGGERGVLSQPTRAEEFRANIDAVVAIGRATGCRAFNALYGNRVDGDNPAQQDRVGVDNLRRAADAVAEIDGVVLLEPVSGTPAYPLKTAADALSIIEKVGKPNVKLLADFYHLAANGDDVAQVIEDHAADFGHIQIADHPGRNEPGTGDLPLERWIDRSRELGYEGVIGLEYKASHEDPFAWLPRERRA